LVLLLPLFLTAATITWSSSARAQQDPSTEERARELFSEGRELMNQQRHDEACQKFQESIDTYPSIGAQLNLGRCNELRGRSATAFAAYKRAAKMATSAGDGERADAAERFATAIEGKLAWVTIRATELQPDTTIALDGKPVSHGALATPQPIDPGTHRVTVNVPGKPEWEETFTLRHGQSHTLRLSGSGAAPRGETPSATAPEPDEPTRDTAGPNPLLVSGVVASVVGGAGIIVGAVFGGLAIKDRDDMVNDPALCPNMECTAEGRAVKAQAEERGEISTATITVGAILLAGGITMIVLSSLRIGEAADAELRVGPASASLAVEF
jgi:hypothetical protein